MYLPFNRFEAFNGGGNAAVFELTVAERQLQAWVVPDRLNGEARVVHAKGGIDKATDVTFVDHFRKSNAAAVLPSAVPTHQGGTAMNLNPQQQQALLQALLQATASQTAQRAPSTVFPACDTVSKGLQLEPDDTARVRHLLSDFEAVMIPEGMVLGPPWDNRKVCLALAKRGETHKDLWKKDLCVQLYPQRPGCAVLYWPTTKYADAPLHLNPRRASWRPSVLEAMAPYVRFAHSDRKGRGRENSNFDHYRVADWDGLALALGL